MKYAFFGTPEFAAIIIKKLLDANLSPNLIVCNPDKPSGRKKIITSPRAKIIAEENNINIFQPEDFKQENIEKLKDFDFFVVAAYAKILPEEIINLPRLNTIGVHPSLLPKYRGATPIQAVILNGEQKTGVSLYLLDEKMDNGPILTQSELSISESETYGSLHNKLAELSADLLIKTLPKFAVNKITAQIQNHAKATYTKKINTEDAFIEYETLEKAQEQGGEIAQIIDRKIRALNPEPGTWTINKEEQRIKLLESKIKNDKLILKVIQKQGKTPTFL